MDKTKEENMRLALRDAETETNENLEAAGAPSTTG